MTVPEAYRFNAGYATAWRMRVAPVIDALSQRDCHIKQIRIRLDKVTVEIVPGEGQIASLPAPHSVVYGRTTYLRSTLANATIIWENDYADQ